MKPTRFATTVLVTVLFFAGAHHLGAAIVTFDFGTDTINPNNSQNGGLGNWTPFADETTPISTSASTTIDGLEMTINGVAVDGNATADEFWGINSQGIGIHTDGGSGAASRRIDGAIGEAVVFSFNQDVTMTSLRLGSTTLTTEETTVTVTAGPTVTLLGSGSPLTEYSLLDTFVAAGTDVTLTTSVPVGGGVLFNEITVDVIPEPCSIALIGMALLGFGIAFRRR